MALVHATRPRLFAEGNATISETYQNGSQYFRRSESEDVSEVDETRPQLTPQRIKSILSTRSMEVDSEPKRVKKKAVKFAVGSKTWDGLKSSHADFDELLYCFLIRGQSIGDGDVLRWTKESFSRIFHMCRLLKDLVTRINTSAAGSSPVLQVPCLPCGGGRAIRVEKEYQPYLKSLLSVLVTALNTCFKSTDQAKVNKMLNGVYREELQSFLKRKTDVRSMFVKEK